jgi:glycosyltransferase involved in cell wall biosynthesis
MSKRVLHVFKAMNVGGAETMILNLYRALNREKIQFDFLVHEEEIGYYDQEIIALGGRIFRLPLPKMKSIKSYQRQLFELFSQYQFCAIHSHVHSFSGFILDVAKKANIPVRVAHSHTTFDGRKQTLPRQAYQSYMKWNLKKNATHMFSCSKAAGESLFGKKAPACVLPNSFNLQKYEQQANKKVPDSTHSQPLVIGHVGRFDAVKNHPFFIETFYHFKKTHVNAAAWLIGDGPDRSKIENLIRKYHLEDSVKLWGIRSDIPALLSKMDMFLFPSEYEGLGNVVIEAQAAGVACLVSDAVPEEVDLSLNLVTFCHLNDGPEEWAKKLGQMASIKEKPSWDQRKKNLKKYGYDVMENAKYLEKVYSGH